MNAIFSRHNITGGVSQLMPTGGGPCFFEDVLQKNEAIMMADNKRASRRTSCRSAISRDTETS